MKTKTLSSVISAILILSSVCGAADVYYDVNFSSPEHTVGLPPAVGDQPTRPSRIVFGSPVVENALGALDNQPLVFNTAGNPGSFFYDQIAFDVGRNQPRYFVSFDMITEALLGSRNHFVLNFDTPSVRNIQFESDGSIIIYDPRSVAIGRFSDDTVMHFEVDIDTIQRNWSISMNGGLLHNGVFVPDNDIEHIRFSLGLLQGDRTGDDRTFVGLDNIVVANAPVPEPASALIMILGATLIRRVNRES